MVRTAARTLVVQVKPGVFLLDVRDIHQTKHRSYKMKTSRLALAVITTATIGISSIALAQNSTMPGGTVSPSATAPRNAPVNGTNGAPSTVNRNAPNNTDEGTTGRTTRDRPAMNTTSTDTSDSSSSMATERAPKPARH
jgi:hypothetical protein